MQPLLILDLQYANGSCYKTPIQKVVFSVPFQCDIYPVSRMRDTLQLIRKDDNDALFRTARAGAGKMVLSKHAWVVPIVQQNDVPKVNLYKSIAANSRVQCLPGFGGVNVKRFLYLKQDTPSGDWVLALLRKSHDGYWLDCKQARVVTRKEMLPFLIIVT